ncbi:hypothetical protein BpHYR1_037721 [Brachionus plicatilis]|uniref:Uncharacterized protein n=1 Tax=Brachionus plicatilis TaxID=10195 RepID=A0A3M7SBV8_BRAPC|nr:hypothetical protein BpHYR1_037721 [Brachionus plicatilis]
MPFPELNDNKFEKNLTSGAHSYREKVREQILNTPRSERSSRIDLIDLTIINEASNYRPSSRRSTDALGFEQSRLKSASRDRQIIRYNKYIPSKESHSKESVKISEDPYLDKEFMARPSSRESFYHDTPRLGARSILKKPKSLNEQSQLLSSDNLENNLTKSIDYFDFDTNKSKPEQAPVPKPRQKDNILFNKQNMLFNENENLKIKRNTNSLNSSRVITPRFEHSRLNRYSTTVQTENDTKDGCDKKLNDSLRDDWIRTRTKTNLSIPNENSSFDSNEINRRNVYKKM